MTYVTPGLRTKIRFCQVIVEDLLFTGTITEGTTVCQYVNTETQDVQVSSTYKVRLILFWCQQTFLNLSLYYLLVAVFLKKD